MNRDIGSAIAIVAFLFALIGASITANLMRRDYEASAIKAQCAGYNPTTGAFEWKEKAGG